jgi:hypothetical protein
VLWAGGCVYEPSIPRSAPINRVVCPTPHFLATGDDDGTVKVSGLRAVLPVAMIFKPAPGRGNRSYGTHGSRMPFARIRSILTSYRTFFGCKTKSSWSRRGASVPLPPLPPLFRHFCSVIETVRAAGMVPYLSWMCAQKSRSQLHTRRIRKTNYFRLYRSKGEHASPLAPLDVSYLLAQGHKNRRGHPARHHFHLQSQ